MRDFFATALISSLLSLVFLIFFRPLALKAGIFKSKNGTPYIGGIVCALAFVTGYSYYLYNNNIILPLQLVWLLVFSYLVLVVELLDDLKDFSLRWRIIIQVIVVALYLMVGKKTQIYFLPGWLNYCISFLWILGITHAFNHLDIADGLCGGLAFIISLSFLCVSLVSFQPFLVALFFSLSAGLAVFLVFNLDPAKVYLGNSGSHFLGFLLATLCMYGDYATLSNVIRLPLPVLGLLVPIFILAFPIIDTLLLIVIRMKKGILPVKKSDDHIFLLFRRSGYSMKHSLLTMYGLTGLWCFSGLAIVLGKNLLAFLFFLLALAYTAFVIVKAMPKAGLSSEASYG
jgi:UDP-GlcNAc:undecaprenyl-phosphate GlcNAc-1-phosphate transferase